MPDTTPRYWRAVESLFSDAAALEAPARAALLAAHRTAAPRVVAEVESLLAADAHATHFLATVAWKDQAVEPPRPEPNVLGRTIGHYQLVERLGRGGMGEVFRADDLALGREVAFKLLPRAVDPALKSQLLREADASARLQHPAIATFYEAGEANGEAFIAMEYVRGDTLRHRLAHGPLPHDEAWAATRCLLEALAHAHAAGILHRDIKPENIILTAHQTAKLLDFGIAKRLSIDNADAQLTLGATLVTGRSSVVGTVGYFAPEQVLGEPLDARTDLFQVGLVLFEMLTGEPAFGGTTPFERVAALMTKTPDLGRLEHAGVPHAAVETLRRALSREPSARPPTAAAFLRALFDGPSTAAALPPTLAVLDLRNLGGHADDAWIGSGVAESLMTELARVPGLRVVVRDKVLRATRQARSSAPDAGSVDAIDVGRQLGCRWIVSGSYQRSGPQLRLTTALVDVASEQVVAAEKMDGAVAEIFTVQDRLCRAVALSLDLHVPDPRPADTSRAAQAFECYARGRRLWQRLEKGTFEEARELYLRAIAIDPDHAKALSGLAAVHALRFPYTTDPQDLAKAAAYARRAIAADPSLGDPHLWLGYALLREERFEEAYRAARRASALDADEPYGPYFASVALLFSGRAAEAIPLTQRALELEPTHGMAWTVLAQAHISVGNLEAAEWCLRRAIALEGEPAAAPSPGGGAYLAECFRLGGRVDEARSTCLATLEALERSDHMYRDTLRGVALACLARVAFDQHDHEAARAALGQVLALLQGRPRALGGGHLVVQALAGLARAGDAARYDEAARLFAAKDRFNFLQIFGCDEASTVLALARAALALGRSEGAELLERSRACGSYEARLLLEAD